MKKDTLLTQMNFHQHFYVLSHNSAAGIMTFVNDVQSKLSMFGLDPPSPMMIFLICITRQIHP